MKIRRTLQRGITRNHTLKEEFPRDDMVHKALYMLTLMSMGIYAVLNSKQRFFSCFQNVLAYAFRTWLH